MEETKMSDFKVGDKVIVTDKGLRDSWSFTAGKEYPIVDIKNNKWWGLHIAILNDINVKVIAFAHQIQLVDKILTENEQKASKNDSKKPDLSLIPYVALIKEAEALMVGEKKYGRYNYTKGHKASQLIAALMRHTLAWYQGEENDPEDGQHHLGAARACLSMLLRQQELGTLIDDRYNPNNKGEKDGI